MQIAVEETEGVHVARVGGRLDTLSADDFADRLTELVDGGARLVVLDLSGVTGISSMGIASIVLVGKRLFAAGGRLLVAGARGQVLEVLRLAGMEHLFPFYATAREAVASGGGA